MWYCEGGKQRDGNQKQEGCKGVHYANASGKRDERVRLFCEKASGPENEILDGKTLTITRVGNDGTAKLKSDTPFSGDDDMNIQWPCEKKSKLKRFCPANMPTFGKRAP